MRRDSVKLPHVLPHRPMPRMPELAGYAPRFDAIAAVPAHAQPVKGIRPLYWWARELRSRGDVLVNLDFDADTKTATVSVRLASYQVVTVQRRHDNKCDMPHDLPTLIAEAIWRLGSLGWTAELRSVIDLIDSLGLVLAPTPVLRRTDLLPDLGIQPDRAVRMAYWWALVLKRHGWKLDACGDAVARGGFIAEIPNADGGMDMVIYPGDMADDGTEASALANHLARLGKTQRRVAGRVIGDTTAGQGRVS